MLKWFWRGLLFLGLLLTLGFVSMFMEGKPAPICERLPACNFRFYVLPSLMMLAMAGSFLGWVACWTAIPIAFLVQRWPKLGEFR